MNFTGFSFFSRPRIIFLGNIFWFFLRQSFHRCQNQKMTKKMRMKIFSFFGLYFPRVFFLRVFFSSGFFVVDCLSSEEEDEEDEEVEEEDEEEDIFIFWSIFSSGFFSSDFFCSGFFSSVLFCEGLFSSGFFIVSSSVEEEEEDEEDEDEDEEEDFFIFWSLFSSGFF